MTLIIRPCTTPEHIVAWLEEHPDTAAAGKDLGAMAYLDWVVRVLSLIEDDR